MCKTCRTGPGRFCHRARSARRRRTLCKKRPDAKPLAVQWPKSFRNVHSAANVNNARTQLSGEPVCCTRIPRSKLQQNKDSPIRNGRSRRQGRSRSLPAWSARRRNQGSVSRQCPAQRIPCPAPADNGSPVPRPRHRVWTGAVPCA